MKITIILFLAILIQCRLTAQEKFIEVTVSDTAWVKPDNIIYSIRIIRDNEMVADTLQYADPKSYNKKLMQVLAQQKKSLDSLACELGKKRFRILPPTFWEEYSLAGENEFKDFPIVVKVSSVDSLKILRDLVAVNKNISGFVLKCFAKNERPALNYLYQKIMLEATERAKVLAALSKKKAGQVISVTESEEQKGKSEWAIYPPLSSQYKSAVPGWHTDIVDTGFMIGASDDIVSTYVLYKTLIVRFAID